MTFLVGDRRHIKILFNIFIILTAIQLMVVKTVKLFGQQVASQETIIRVAKLIKELESYPDKWELRLVNEAEWKRSHSLRGWPINRTRGGFTDRSLGDNEDEALTILELKYVETNSDAEVKSTIAHEIGHVICDCHSEKQADIEAYYLLKKDVNAIALLNHLPRRYKQPPVNPR